MAHRKLVFTPKANDNFDVNYTVDGKPETGEVFYAEGDTFTFQTGKGAFSVRWELEDGDIGDLQSPLEGNRPEQESGADGPPWTISRKVQTGIPETVRKAIREERGFIARYHYKISVETREGALSDIRVGTFDC